MSSNKFAKEEDFFKKLFFNDLEQVPGADDRETPMEEIDTFIESCLTFGANPLKYLRKALPQYKWGWVGFDGDPQSIDDVRPVVRKADFLWWQDHTGFVWARMPDRKGARIHYIFRSHHCYVGTMKMIMEAGATILSKDEDIVAWANSLLTDNPIRV
jgi:hypothetical protein